jgi:hypothetical protein
MDERLCTWLEVCGFCRFSVYGEQGFVPVQGIELIKAFNIWEENAAIQIPVLPVLAWQLRRCQHNLAVRESEWRHFPPKC